MKKQVIRLTEGDLHQIIENSVKRYLNESEDNPVLDYTHFALNKKTNLIVNGWDYHDEDGEDLKLFKHDYFDVDLIDNDFNPRDYKIWRRKTCLRYGIDPNDNRYWSNDGQTSVVKDNDAV